MLVKEIISVYIENHKELTNTRYGFTWVYIEYVCFILRAILVSYKKSLKTIESVSAYESSRFCNIYFNMSKDLFHEIEQLFSGCLKIQIF